MKSYNYSFIIQQTMKRIFVNSFCMLVFLCATANVWAEGNEQLPAILQNHKNKAQFTKLKAGEVKPIILFNGTDLTGFYTFTHADGVNKNAGKEFAVDDHLLHFTGENMGYISTNASYKNYYLRVVFRWGDKKYEPRLNTSRDSGILYHFKEGEKDQLWPNSIECQIQEDDCGDYWCVNGATADSPNKSKMEGTQKHIIRTANYERPLPKWNTIEIICIDDKSEHYVNGHLVNNATNLSTTEGKILFQLEGAEIYYKTIELIPLK
jgi:hypothetical protein